jgi:hypothetical protein
LRDDCFAGPRDVKKVAQTISGGRLATKQVALSATEAKLREVNSCSLTALI